MAHTPRALWKRKRSGFLCSCGDIGYEVHYKMQFGPGFGLGRCVGPAACVRQGPREQATHADEQGTREYNLALGARRATSVRNYLVSQGISESRLSIVTYGKERPIEVCSMEKCWSKNRRSVTVVSGGLGS